MSLKTSGLLSGEEDRKRMSKDVKDYPDIAALASFAKTKEQFHEILVSPGGSPGISPSTSPVDSPLRPHCPSFDLFEIYDNPLRGSSPFDGGSLVLPEPEARMDPERADLLWNLAGHGSPQLKPLDTLELEADGAPKSGVYLLSSPNHSPREGAGKFQTIFKPLDEEAFERRGIENGMGAIREEAAFVIDRASGGKACVPVTARASLEEGGIRKKGSVQQFVEGTLGPVENFGIPRDLPSSEAMISLNDAQAVACLDIRIFNTDRHAGNLLLAGPRPHRVVCIDHGCVLPAWWALDSARFDAWIDWPHVRAPASPETVNLVRRVSDALPSVAQELEKLGLPRQAICTLEICTLLLRHGVLSHGLSLRSIALLMTRADLAEPCWLERKIEQACVAAGVAAEFVPEGKYGDLVFHTDQQLVNQFLATGGSTSNKRLTKFHDAFFSFLDSAFEHTDVIHAAKVVEEAMKPPWE